MFFKIINFLFFHGNRRYLREGFTVCACAADIDEARALSALEPDYVAVEPPELIGGASIDDRNYRIG